MNGDSEDDTSQTPWTPSAGALGEAEQQAAQYAAPTARRATLVKLPTQPAPPAPTGEGQSTDTTVMPLETATSPGPTQEQLSDMPSAQLPPARAKLAPGAATTYQGYATNFASPQDLARYKAAKAAGKSEQEALAVGDNGVGAPRLGSVNTANAFGIAVPTQYLRRHFGNDPADWRTARAELTTQDGQTVRVPFVDIGPSQKQQANQVISDLTYQLSQGLGTGGKARVTMKMIPNAGPDIIKDKDGWNQEQGKIGQQFPLGTPDIVRPPASENPVTPRATQELSTAQTDSDTGSDYTGPNLGGPLGAVNA